MDTSETHSSSNSKHCSGCRGTTRTRRYFAVTCGQSLWMFTDLCSFLHVGPGFTYRGEELRQGKLCGKEPLCSSIKSGCLLVFCLCGGIWGTVQHVMLRFCTYMCSCAYGCTNTSQSRDLRANANWKLSINTRRSGEVSFVEHPYLELC